MNIFQRIKLAWLTHKAKSLYSRWCYLDAVSRSHYTNAVSHRALQAEIAMNEYRHSLGLVPLWSYSGRWTPADGKSTGLNAASMTPEQYWTSIANLKRLLN